MTDLDHNGFIKKTHHDTDNKAHRYIIELPGKAAVIDKLFLNSVWFRATDFWKFLLPFTIAVIGLLNSIYQWWVVN